VNTYMVTRWGNPKDGPDGEDTNFLVIAPSYEVAAECADVALADYPQMLGENVENRAHLVVELGISSSSVPGVFHGPWIAHSVLRACESVSWQRIDGEWRRNDE